MKPRHHRLQFIPWLLVGVMIAGPARAEVQWQVAAPVLVPGLAGAFDETAVKDPSVVFFQDKWHVFYTARGRGEYTTGYVAAPTLEGLRDASRHELKQVRGRGSRYACAPQVFFFAPRGLWYLVYQTRDANYQPAYSTTKTIDRPESWSPPEVLVAKDEEAKWIDFWVIFDETTAYLFYTRSHRDVCVRTTALEAFPHGWSKGEPIFGGVHEAVHIYKVQGRDEYHMVYELNEQGVRSFGLASANRLTGPWENLADSYATGTQLRCESDEARWTDMASHGEMIRSGYDQRLEYNADSPAMLIQGRLDNAGDTPYPNLPWRLGLIKRNTIDTTGDK
jgi:Glycosyl hydrolase family 62